MANTDKIKSVVIHIAEPGTFFANGDCLVKATMEDGTERDVFSFYSDELKFTAEEFVGLNIDQARHLKFKKDVEYLRS